MLGSWRSWARVERGLGPRTLAEYTRELERLQAAGYGPLEQLGTRELRAFIHSAGGAPSTVAKRIAALRSFYRFLVRAEHREDDPTVRLDRPKVPARLPRPVPDVENKLLTLPPDIRNGAIVLLETGLRLSEAYSLDVTPPAPDVLVVLGKGQKERPVPLTARAREALDALAGRMPRNPRSFQRCVRRAGFTPHQLRHTLGCDLAESGSDIGDIQEILGHASPTTTRGYARYSVDRLRRAHDRRRR